MKARFFFFFRAIIVLISATLVFGCSDEGEIAIKEISLNKTMIAGNIGGTDTLSVTVLPSNATSGKMLWSSSNNKVATVNDKGIVNFVGVGETIITVKINDDTFAATCSVFAMNIKKEDLIGMIDMVLVEGGTFTMGADSNSEAVWSENPAHQVTLTKDFYIGKTEVTQALWYAVMNSIPTSSFGTPWNSAIGMGDNYPAYFISWYDIQHFITILNVFTGKEYRLPTEAEWEYAARGGKKSRGYRYSGSNKADDVSWSIDNSGYKLHEVGTKAANELEIFDMSGNVEERCQDMIGGYSNVPQTDPIGTTNSYSRVIRGGSWFSVVECMRVTYRSFDSPDERNPCGFRLVCNTK